MISPPKETKTLMKELKAWMKNNRGGVKEIAKELGVERQTVLNWASGHRTPMLKHWFALQEFLDKKRSAE